MKCIVTGGAGFIGSNLIHYLKEKHTEKVAFEIACLSQLKELL